MIEKQPKFFYVYLITNIISKKQYVGSRKCYSNDICKDSYMSSSKYLQNDIKLLGIENFEKEILDSTYTNTEDMLNGETDYILKYNTLWPNGYNKFLPNNKIGFHMSGHSHTEKTKQQIAESVRKKMVGRVFSEKTKKKMSESAKLKIGNKNGMFGKNNLKKRN